MLLAILVASLYRQLKSSSIRGIHPNTIFNVFVPPRTTRSCFSGYENFLIARVSAILS